MTLVVADAPVCGVPVQVSEIADGLALARGLRCIEYTERPIAGARPAQARAVLLLVESDFGTRWGHAYYS